MLNVDILVCIKSKIYPTDQRDDDEDGDWWYCFQSRIDREWTRKMNVEINILLNALSFAHHVIFFISFSHRHHNQPPPSFPVPSCIRTTLAQNWLLILIVFEVIKWNWVNRKDVGKQIIVFNLSLLSLCISLACVS